jgi:hypothetical protein
MIGEDICRFKNKGQNKIKNIFLVISFVVTWTKEIA